MRKQLTAPGFRATSHTTDQYGRHVSVVYRLMVRNLNVWLARNGFANDRYLKEFRHENPSLAALLDPAFAAAKTGAPGSVGRLRDDACWASHLRRPLRRRAAATPATRTSASRRRRPGLNCGDISYRRFRVLAPDPHHFDSDGDGIGCESG